MFNLMCSLILYQLSVYSHGKKNNNNKLITKHHVCHDEYGKHQKERVGKGELIG